MIYKLCKPEQSVSDLKRILASDPAALHGQCFRLQSERDIHLLVLLSGNLMTCKVVLPTKWNRAGAPFVQMVGNVIEDYQWLGQTKNGRIVWEIASDALEEMLLDADNPDYDVECGSEVFVIDESEGPIIRTAGEIESGSIVQFPDTKRIGWLFRDGPTIRIVIHDGTQAKHAYPLEAWQEMWLVQTPEQLAETFLTTIGGQV